MSSILGIVFVFVMVIGGYLLSGGKFGIILKALPFEMIIIGGAAVGAFLVANDGHGIKQTLRDLGKVFKGPKWAPDDYRDLLCLLFELIRLAKSDPVKLDPHIEEPRDSEIFARYPKIQSDSEAISLICDTLRAATLNYDDPHQVEEILENRLDALLHQRLHSSHALQTVADGLPALGIVAAVLGVIKTMGSIDKPPEILGKMIGGALVGTFLGVFLAYALVGPFATRIKAVVEDDDHFYQLIKEVLIANLHEHPSNICIEVGRQNTPAQNRPSYSELENALRATKDAA